MAPSARRLAANIDGRLRKISLYQCPAGGLSRYFGIARLNLRITNAYHHGRELPEPIEQSEIEVRTSTAARSSHEPGEPDAVPDLPYAEEGSPLFRGDQTKDRTMSQNHAGSRRRARLRLPAEMLEDRQLLAVYFDNPVYTVSAQSGTVGISLQNDLGPAPTAPTQVVLSLGGGTAVPGVDYTPQNLTVNFAANQGSQTIQVPVLPGSASEGTRIVELNLAPTAGSAPTTGAFLVITHNADTTPPTVVSSKVLTKGSNVTGFVITFSKDMSPGPLDDVSNYAIADPKSLRPAKGGDAVVATRFINLKSAVYNPTTHSVTLLTAGKVKKFPFFSIMDRESANELDLAGQKTMPTPAQLVMPLGPFADTNGNPLSEPGAGAGAGYLDAIAVEGKAGNRFLKAVNPNTSAPGLHRVPEARKF